MKIKSEVDAHAAFHSLDLQVMDEFNRLKKSQKPINYEDIVMFTCIMQLFRLLDRRTKLVIAQKVERMIEDWGAKC